MFRCRSGPLIRRPRRAAGTDEGARAGTGDRGYYGERDQPGAVRDRNEYRDSAESRKLNAQFISKIPVGRWGKVEEIGALAAFLCSDDAGFITGTDILIDGGWCAM